MSDIKFVNNMALYQAHLCKFYDSNKKAFPNNEFNKREFYYIFKIRKAFQELKNKKSNYILQYNSYTEIIKIINEHNSEILSFHRNFLSNKTNRTTERPYIWHLFHDVSTLDNISSFYSPYTDFILDKASYDVNSIKIKFLLKQTKILFGKCARREKASLVFHQYALK